MDAVGARRMAGRMPSLERFWADEHSEDGPQDRGQDANLP